MSYVFMSYKVFLRTNSLIVQVNTSTRKPICGYTVTLYKIFRINGRKYIDVS